MKTGITIVLVLFSFLYICPSGQTQTVSGITNSYFKVVSINTASNSVTVDDASGLSSGQRVLIIEAKGAAIGGANASTFGDITAINNAGNYEFNTICTISGNEVVLKATLLNSYDAAGSGLRGA